MPDCFEVTRASALMSLKIHGPPSAGNKGAVKILLQRRRHALPGRPGVTLTRATLCRVDENNSASVPAQKCHSPWRFDADRKGARSTLLVASWRIP